MLILSFTSIPYDGTEWGENLVFPKEMENESSPIRIGAPFDSKEERFPESPYHALKNLEIVCKYSQSLCI
jgi:hypothetical protein